MYTYYITDNVQFLHCYFIFKQNNTLHKLNLVE